VKRRRPTVRVDLSGPDGNVFVLRSIVIQTLNSRLGKQTAVEFGERFQELHESGKTYSDALDLMNEYVNMVDVSEGQDS
jgi:hypothetical protein